MPVLDFPPVLPSNLSWALACRSQTFGSELSGTIQTAALPGEKWVATLVFDKLVGSDARRMRAFLAALRGSAGRFRLYPFDHPTPAGTAAGAPLVKGAGQTGLSIITDGWVPNQAGVLLAGDYIQLGSELKMVTADVASDAGGNATIPFSPPLRSSPGDNTAVVTQYPTAVMRLTNDQQAQWQVQSPVIYAMTIACEEALDI